MAENSAGKQRGKPFEKGQSGNPAGKPKGARHKTTLLAEKLMAGDAQEVVKAVLVKAKGGDMTAARIVLDRIAPARRDNSVTFELPAIESAVDAAKVLAALLAAVAAGEVTPSEALDVTRVIEGFGKILETSELEQRIAALEKERPR
jgi:hypothetical protein